MPKREKNLVRKSSCWMPNVWSGTILRADVAGQILMRAYLSGTPECKFGLNDKLLLDKDTVNRAKWVPFMCFTGRQISSIAL